MGLVLKMGSKVTTPHKNSPHKEACSAEIYSMTGLSLRQFENSGARGGGGGRGQCCTFK